MNRDTHDPMLTNADTTAVAQLIDTDLNESQRARRLAQLVLGECWEMLYNDRDEEYWVLEGRYDALCAQYDGLHEAVSQLVRTYAKMDLSEEHEQIVGSLDDILVEFRPRSEIGT